MLNRHYLRAKLLQGLYAYVQSGQKELQKGVNYLESTFIKTHDLYLVMLYLLKEICFYNETYVEEQVAKHLDENRIPISNRLTDLNFIKAIDSSESFQAALKKTTIDLNFSPELLRKLYMQLFQSEEFKVFEAKKSISLVDEYDILLFLYRHIVIESDLLDNFMEDSALSWDMDKYLVEQGIQKTLKKFSEKGILQPEPISPDWQNDKMFAFDLFKYAIANSVELSDWISKTTENWDVERISTVDLLIIKLCISEMIKFPEIPLKVSMNEYIELGKEFSTPKSKVYINGMLDKLSKELVSKGIIKKYGKGLVE